MNFDAAEALRTELNAGITHLKTIKTKSQQTKYNALVKRHDHSMNELLKELTILQEEFKIFKLHTLSTIENKQLPQRATKCVTNPFSIYITQR